MLVAATGVGAGDLATGAFTGAKLGVAVLWAAVLGAILKFVLGEGLARWQIATGQTVLEGALLRLGRPLRWIFLLYLVPWTWFVGSALISACGVCSHALLPLLDDPADGKIAYGAVCSLAGLALVRRGGFRLFERCMRVCIALMFVTVVVTAALLVDDWGAVIAGLLVPRIPDAGGQGLTWTLALIGGVGGTLTVICYGYWIRETGRDGEDDLWLCRVDLAVGYGVTALFGIAMVILGSGVEVTGSGAGLVVLLADRLEELLGPVAALAFLLGAFGAVFSSLLGVWQAVPYVFADFWAITVEGRQGGAPVDTAGRPYRVYLYAIALVPLLGLRFPFREVQKLYSVVGALFLPLLALTLLLLNGRRDWVGERLRNRWASTLALTATLLFFALIELLRWFD
ncbi:MAG: Nramp family divalent metal transporter [Planctomycetes bacterium]|nr:Nramp family divalent metal transporter [Planctomycetota bacterium]